jgi:ferredoxin-NADP reductase
MSMPRKLRCAVKAITDHGGRVYTVDLEPSATVPSFRPGQFLHLTVDDYDPSSFWPESRVFSIASSPRERDRLQICYSVKGRYTTRMEEKLKVGGEVWVKLPYGEFVINGAEEAVLVAGGTGISAFTAFIGGLSPEQPKPVWLVYGARSPALLLFRGLLSRQLDRVPNLHLLFFAETVAPKFAAEIAASPKLPECLSGRISLDELWARLPKPENKVFYLSGPPAMLSTLGNQLKTRGLAPERIRTDAWE